MPEVYLPLATKVRKELSNKNIANPAFACQPWKKEGKVLCWNLRFSWFQFALSARFRWFSVPTWRKNKYIMYTKTSHWVYTSHPSVVEITKEWRTVSWTYLRCFERHFDKSRKFMNNMLKSTGKLRHLQSYRNQERPNLRTLKICRVVRFRMTKLTDGMREYVPFNWNQDLSYWD